MSAIKIDPQVKFTRALHRAARNIQKTLSGWFLDDVGFSRWEYYKSSIEQEIKDEFKALIEKTK